MKLSLPTQYRTSIPEVRAILDYPRWKEWIVFECEHLNRLVPEVGECVYDLNYFKPEALEWDYYQDEVTKGGHEIVCLLDRMAQLLPIRQHQYLHRGLTSSNVIDSCNHSRWNHLLVVLGRQLDLLFKEISNESTKEVFGLTHGRRAHKTTINHRMEFFARSWARRNAGYLMQPTLMFGGPTGNGSVNHRQASSRHHYFELWAHLAEVCYGMEQLATDYRFYASDFGPVTGVVADNSKNATSSSCMPHKVNPSVFERVCSVGFMTRSLITMQMLQPPQWLDRDLVHSAMERETIDRIWDHTFWLVEEMTRLIRETPLSIAEAPQGRSSFEVFQASLDSGHDWDTARRHAADAKF